MVYAAMKKANNARIYAVHIQPLYNLAMFLVDSILVNILMKVSGKAAPK